MPAGGTDPLYVVLFIVAGAALIVVIGGGAFQSWLRGALQTAVNKSRI
jgi:hypothetical protein